MILKHFSHLLDRLNVSTVRLAVINSLLFVFGIWITIALVYWQVTIFMEQRVNHIIEVYSKQFNELSVKGTLEAVEDSVRRDSRKIDLFGVFSLDGTKVSGNISYLPKEIGLDGQIREFQYKGTSEAFRYQLSTKNVEDQGIFLARAKAVKIDEDLVLIIGRDISEFVVIRRILLNGLITGSSIIFAIGLLIAVMLGVRPIKRIKQIQHLSEQIVLGQFNLRMPISRRRDEIDMLASTVNLMLSEIEKLITEIRGVTATIAHDLRTPLTRVRLLLSKGTQICAGTDSQPEEQRGLNSEQLIMRCSELFEKSIEEADQLLERFTAILRIAEIENHMRTIGFKEINPADILQQIHEMFEPLADAKNIELRLITDPTNNIYADPALLLEAVSNLVDNAVKFTPSTDNCNVSENLEAHSTKILIHLHNHAMCPVIDIVDDGPGIPEDLFESYPHIALHKFQLPTSTFTQNNAQKSPHMDYKVSAHTNSSIPDFNVDYQRRNSYGLGLGIVNAILRMHRFRISVIPTTRGAHIRISCGAQTPNNAH